MAGFLPHGEPYVEILEQPAPRSHRFRYVKEGRSAGAIVGIRSTADAKTYPTIKVMNYCGPYYVVVSCVTDDPPFRPHPHKLVGRNCKDGIFTKMVDDPNMTYSFKGLGVQCAKKSDVESNLKEREKRKMDPFRTGCHITDMNLSVLRLCFQVFIPKADKSYTVLQPVVSETIRDQRTVSSLTISKLSHFSAPAAGGTDVILLCERILGDDVQIWFFEARDSGIEWEVQAEFRPSDIHKQAAISFQIPQYRNINILHPVHVFIQLRRSLDAQERGAPRPFCFTPRRNEISDILPRKIRKVLEFIESNKQFLNSEDCHVKAAQRPNESFCQIPLPRTISERKMQYEAAQRSSESICRIPVPRTISKRNMQYEELSNVAENPFFPASSSSLNLTSQSHPAASSSPSFVFPAQSTNFIASSKYKRKSQEFSESVNSPFSPASPSFNLASQLQPVANPSTSFVFPAQSTVPPNYKRNSLDSVNSLFLPASPSFNLASQSQPVVNPSTSFVFPAQSTVPPNYKRNSLDSVNSPFLPASPSFNLTSQSQPVVNPSTSFVFPAQSTVSSTYERNSLEVPELNPFTSTSTSFSLTSQSQPMARPSTSFLFPDHPTDFVTPSKLKRKSLELSGTMRNPFSSASSSFNRKSLDLSTVMHSPFIPVSSSFNLTSQKETTSRLSTSFESAGFDMPPEVYRKSIEVSAALSNSSSLNMASETESNAGESTSSESTSQSTVCDIPQEVYTYLLELSAAQNNAFSPTPTSLASQIEPVATLSTSYNAPSTAFDMPHENYCQALGIFATESYSFSQASTSHIENRMLNSTVQAQLVGSLNTSSIHPSTVMSPYSYDRSLETLSSISTPMLQQQQVAACELSYENETYSDENDLASILSDSFSSITLDYELPDRKQEK